MEQAEKKLEDLVKKKNNGQTHVKLEKRGLVPILEVIVETHVVLTEAAKKYNKSRSTLAFRYPGGKELILRKYVYMRAPSVRQVEKELGLDGALTELKKKIDEKYSYATGGAKIALPPKEAEEEKSSKANASKADSDKKLKLVK